MGETEATLSISGHSVLSARISDARVLSPSWCLLLCLRMLRQWDHPLWSIKLHLGDGVCESGSVLVESSDPRGGWLGAPLPCVPFSSAVLPCTACTAMYTLVSLVLVVWMMGGKGESAQDCRPGVVVYCNELCAPELHMPNVRHLLFEGVLASLSCVPRHVEVSDKIKQIHSINTSRKNRCHYWERAVRIFQIANNLMNKTFWQK